MAEDIDGSSTRIEKLNDSNFHAWKQNIVLLLALKDLDDLIETDPPTDKTELAKWLKNDRKARAVIGLSLSDEHLEHARDVESAKEMWQTIMNVFERHTLLNKLSARRKFYTVSMENNEKMLTYLNRVKQLAATLKSMNVDIDDQEMAMATLNGLPSSCEGLIIALDALGNDTKTFNFDLVKSRLLQEEQRANERATSIPDHKSSALVSESNCRPNNPGKPHKYSNHRCENCGNIGHSASRCWGKDVNGKRPQNPHPDNTDKSKTNNALVGQHNGSGTKLMTENEFVCLMSKINNPVYPKGVSSWIVDSGCTAHKCFDKWMFDTYTTAEDMNVEMGTKATAKVAGYGSITLKMKCGSDFKVRKLEDVLHVPSFEYSLLSVSSIDKKGMKTTFGGGSCMIHKDGIQIATGSLGGTLYVIECKSSPVSNGTALVSSLQLWHERMAHSDERRIVQMADRGVVHAMNHPSISPLRSPVDSRSMIVMSNQCVMDAPFQKHTDHPPQRNEHLRGSMNY